MQRYKLIIEYEGSHFHGWQRQPNVETVQSALEGALTTVLREAPLGMQAAGRTDAGVHARGQVVAFSTPVAVDLRRLVIAVSGLLKGRVAVLHADYAADGFDPCREALGKQYAYRIVNRSVPLTVDYGAAWHVPISLERSQLVRDAAAFVGVHDFESFRATDCTAKTTQREIFRFSVESDGAQLTLRLAGNGFLKHMVRNIVGTLVDRAQGRLLNRSIAEIISLRDRTQAGMTAPPHGLTLEWVAYTADELQSRLSVADLAAR